MHLYVLFSLLGCVVATVLASAIVGRDPGARASRVAGAAMAITGAWCLVDALGNLASERETALTWLRALGFTYPFLAPLCLDLMCELQPELEPRLRRLRSGLYASASVLATVHFATPWFVSDVHPVAWGWSYSLGPLYPLVFVHSVLVPTFWSVMLLKLEPGALLPPPAHRARARMLGGVISACLVVITVVDVVLPYLGIPAPRVGGAVVSGLAGCTWLVSYRLDHASLTPSAFAREILDTLPDGVAIVHGDGRIRAVNASLARLVRRSREALLGMAVDRLLAEPVGDLGATDLRDRETWLRLPHRETLPVSISTAVLRDRQGHVLGWVLAARDQREVLELRRRLVTSGRLAAVGELAAGIAHEVNNPIAYMQANLNLLQRHAEDTAKALAGGAGEALAAVERLTADGLEAIGRVASIVREVRGFSRGSEDATAPRPVDPNQLLERARRLAAPHLRHCRVECALGEVPAVEIAEQELAQVFLDLILNAARAVPEGGGIRITTDRCIDDVRIRFEDDGTGMDAQTLERLFDPVVTPRSVLEGRGLGLSISYQILRQHGGEIRVDSARGRGTRVEVRIPASTTRPGIEP